LTNICHSVILNIPTPPLSFDHAFPQGIKNRGFMLAKSHGFGLTGIDAYHITIEIDAGKGLPAITIVGLPDSAVRESKERVRSAIKNSGFEFPRGRITINLAPADTKKEGPSFDLPIALGILAASEQLPAEALVATAFLGELSLDGQIKPVPGALASAMAAAKHGFHTIVLPTMNVAEGLLTNDIRVLSAHSLQQTVQMLLDPSRQEKAAQVITTLPMPLTSLHDFEDVKGQTHVKRGLEIAAAGGHNTLLVGPPGTGKTMLARRFPSILPPMNRAEALEATRIYSAAFGNTSTPGGLITERPFRAPHHTASPISIVGGGSDPQPGEVTHAHHGVLFLDELPEFTRGALEALRQPLEDGHVTIARAAKTLRFPARFTLLAAMNPCPCGHLTNRERHCSCSSTSIQKYLSKISGPLMDRIDIHLEVPSLKTTDLLNTPTGETSTSIRARVLAAREIQTQRFQHENTITNSRMGQKQLRKWCKLDENSKNLLKEAIESLGLSARAHDKILKVARTISDLSNSDNILPEHLAEAISYRCLDKMNT
jgi:magnesium chelatase family protein